MITLSFSTFKINENNLFVFNVKELSIPTFSVNVKISPLKNGESEADVLKGRWEYPNMVY